MGRPGPGTTVVQEVCPSQSSLEGRGPGPSHDSAIPGCLSTDIRLDVYLGTMDRLVGWAASEAEIRLAQLGRRLTHVQRVAARASEIGASVVGAHADVLVAAAFVHDIGYAPELTATGFHPLDGARFVRDQGFPELAMLVAHHTCARKEAGLRGNDDLLREFPYEDSLMLRALSYCDLTTGPDGARTTVDARVAEIQERYGREHLVSRAIRIGLGEFKKIEREIEGLLAVSGSPVASRPESQ
jgi:hypothetical protein